MFEQWMLKNINVYFNILMFIDENGTQIFSIAKAKQRP